MLYKYIYYINNFNLSIFKNKNITYIYIYNNIFSCLLKFKKNINIKLKNDKTIEIPATNINIKKLNFLKNFLSQFYFYKFIKIKFTGKGYKIKKNTNQSLVLLFNKAHITNIWWKNIFIKKLKKYKIYIKYSNTFRYINNNIINIRPINIFTKKGLRLSRQILLKKKGKK